MILIKEEFVGGQKWRRAVQMGGDRAIVLWLALKCHASRHPSSEGFVPDEDIDDLQGAPRNARKALQALVNCGGLSRDGSRGPGLLQVVEGGWELLDDTPRWSGPDERLRTMWRTRRRSRRAANRIRPILPTDVCAYCGSRSPLMTLDHVVPICQGGGNEPDNLVPACGECNSRKGGRTPEQAGMVLR